MVVVASPWLGVVLGWSEFFSVVMVMVISP